MPVVPWDGTPPFGGKTIVMPIGVSKRRGRPPAPPEATENDEPDRQALPKPPEDKPD